MGLSNEIRGYLALLWTIEIELAGSLNQASLSPLAFAPAAQEAPAKFVSRRPHRRLGLLDQLAPQTPADISA